ncbi:HAMP domain-containing sensor histidine kinase [Curvibacter sp. APW13]|uniref:sensor histidine kinase n=1 Tax=Curvibacter sp. APW13 TaxID=3077236 RepID=UPI0028DE5EA1|nr:HAMP domain-containing sensor histidine kinase [Curvibacter sp. APW13]MDT8992959.1 HAMP domain-containing sensor histidine kinase [Curvibacter sp. APW13]
MDLQRSSTAASTGGRHGRDERRVAWWARSVRVQLAVLLMAVVTALTGTIGLWSFNQAQVRLKENRAQFEHELTQQLARPMASAMWNFDRTAAAALMDTRLGPVVYAIKAFDVRGELWLSRELTGEDVPDRGEVFEITLPTVEGMEVGRLEVLWSAASLERAVQQTLVILVVQVLLLNAFLLVVFWFGVDRLVFRRVRALQQVLDHAASREAAEDIVAFPVVAQDEFGALTQSINTITTRLRDELEAGQESEEEAREALTSLQNAQEGLVRAEKMAALGSLVAGVAHELNTPIGNIVVVASTQQDRVAQFAQDAAANKLTRRGLEEFVTQTREGADLVFHNATRAAELIQSFKQVAVDQTSERLRSFDLATQIGEVLSVTSPVFGKKKVAIRRNLMGGILMHTYPGPLGQVLTNLLTNAVFHGLEDQPAGIITVSCSDRKGWAIIEVEDNGCGMPPEVLGRIFDPFFTTKLGRGGTGLGLHICHNIVYGPLRGRLRVKSVVGQGTTFTIEIPCQIQG